MFSPPAKKKLYQIEHCKCQRIKSVLTHLCMCVRACVYVYISMTFHTYNMVCACDWSNKAPLMCCTQLLLSVCDCLNCERKKKLYSIVVQSFQILLLLFKQDILYTKLFRVLKSYLWALSSFRCDFVVFRLFTQKHGKRNTKRVKYGYVC